MLLGVQENTQGRGLNLRPALEGWQNQGSGEWVFHRKGVFVFGGVFGEGTVSSAGSTRQHLWVTPIPRTLHDSEPAVSTELPIREGTGQPLWATQVRLAYAQTSSHTADGSQK